MVVILIIPHCIHIACVVRLLDLIMANLRRRRSFISFFSFFFLVALIFSFFSLSTCRDTITPTQPLHENETLVSSDGTFSLGFFSPSNSNNRRYVGLWYARIPEKTVLWVGNRRNPVTSSGGAVLALTANGTLLITDGNSTAFWSSDLKNEASDPVAQLRDDGNLVVRDAGASDFAWQSYDYLTDTLIPGMKLGWNLKSRLERNLTAWASEIDPSPGNYTLSLDLRGDPQLMFWSGQELLWRSGPWTGADFSGQNPTTSSGADTFFSSFVNNPDEIYYTANVVDPSTLTRLVVNQTGSTRRYIVLHESNVWNLYSYTPRGPCDTYAFCGPNGVCDPNSSPTCSCLQGFETKSPDNWALRYTSDGCVRKTKLDCRTGTNGFVTLSRAKLPDMVSSMVDMSMSLDDCKAMCLRNCSCTGYASADMRLGGCIFWTGDLKDIVQLLSVGQVGQDLHFRVAAVGGDESAARGIISVVTVFLVLGTPLIALISCCAWREQKRKKRDMIQQKKKKKRVEWPEELDAEGDGLELPLNDPDTIVAATDNFSLENKLGEGGFGPVYKGKLPGGQEIAVKRLSRTSNQGTGEFKNEVLLIAKLQHRNLVRLLGYCTQREDRMLIYEYMPNKSLDTFLFDKREIVTLDWQTRFNIIIGIARGLLYLHQDSRFRIIHRDIKASNILLDEEMNPKISDFGLARIFGGDEANSRTRRVVGTYGYMSPEYAMDGIFSVKSDVFSFGVLVLEIVSGQRNKLIFVSEAEANLLGKAWRLWNEGESLELVDPSLGSDFSIDEAIKCIKIGLLCVQEKPEARPTMSSVVPMLGNKRDAPTSQPLHPGFTTRRDVSDPNLSPTGQDPFSANEMSFTVDVGR